MNEHIYTPIGEHEEKIGRTTFIISSFCDNNSEKTAEQLLCDILKSKAVNGSKEEKIA